MTINDSFNKAIAQYHLKLEAEQLEKFEAYYKLLQEYNQRMSLVSNLDEKAFYLEHLTDSLSFHLAKSKLHLKISDLKVIDLGSGGGFPAIVLSILYPHLQITMLESVKKKAHFLETVIHELQIENASVLSERIEIIGNDNSYRETFHLVTARALAGISVVLEYAMPLMQTNGYLVAFKTEKELQNLNIAQKAAAHLGGKYMEAILYTMPEKDLKRALMIFQKTDPTPTKYPRKPGIPKKRPLFE
jgi:16S rRNA (guanine527-N7)-methyltransferase